MSLKDQLLQVLPPFQYRKMLITPTQSTGEIVTEILDAHAEFAPDYDRIADFFCQGSSERTLKQLFDFVTQNIRYRIEPVSNQTTISPAGILAIGVGDCKHYASFMAGVLDAINRSGCNYFDWQYRFVGYDPGSKDIEHVFVVVHDWQGNEIWLDPAPITIQGGRKLTRYFNDRLAAPTVLKDYKPRKMALTRLSGIGFASHSQARRNGESSKHCCGGKMGFISPQEVLNRAKDTLDDGFLNQSYPPGITKIWPGPVGVTYTVNGMDLVFPVKGSRAQIPSNLIVRYPDYFSAVKIPADLPRPQVVGNRLVLLPKLGTWDYVKANDWFWFKFMVQSLVPLIHSFSQDPDWTIGLDESYEHTGTLANVCAYDLDNSSIVDYITGRPIVLPLIADIPQGVQYLVNGQPLQWPENRALNTVEFNRENPPPPFPAGLQILYPAKYLGFDVPANLPKIQVGMGKLYLADKGILMDDFKANNFIWYSMIVRAMAPLINGFAQFPYVGSGDQLASRVWDDVNGKLPIANYLIPPESKTFIGGLIQNIAGYVEEVWKGILKFVNAGSRLAFLGLVRINAWGFAYKLFYQYNFYDSKRELEQIWREIGGSVGELKSAIELGCLQDALFADDQEWIREAVRDGVIDNGWPGYPNIPAGVNIPGGTDQPGGGTSEPESPIYQPGDYFTDPLGDRWDRSITGAKRMGVVGIDDVAYYLAAAAAVIAALAKFLKGIGGPETDKVVDDVVNGIDVLLAAAGEDPIGTGGTIGAPVKVKDPVTGKEYTINPPPNFNDPPGNWFENHPLETGGLILAAWYLYNQSHKNKRA